MTVTAMKRRARDEFEAARNLLEPVLVRFGEFVIGHPRLGADILTVLLAEGHVVLKGNPGIAKTFSVKVVNSLSGMDFSRLQFTPDLLPADIIGVEIYRPQTQEFVTRKGPIFANLVLGDEINRASPKTQSALLEAMEERQVTIGGQTYTLEPPYTVFATMNPLEHEGTYPLPEAQLDRFMFEVPLSNVETIDELMDIDNIPDLNEAEAMLSKDQVLELIALANDVSASQMVRYYRAELIMATRRHPAIRVGASDRRSKLLLKAAKARALIHGRSYVTPTDVASLAHNTLRHVLILTDEAEIESVNVDDVIGEIVDDVKMPKES